MDKVIAQLAARMLREYNSTLGSAGCNDYELPATPEHLAIAQAMIAEGDYPDDKPNLSPVYRPQGNVTSDAKYKGKGIMLMDWEPVHYLIRQLEAYAGSK